MVLNGGDLKTLHSGAHTSPVRTLVRSPTHSAATQSGLQSRLPRPAAASQDATPAAKPAAPAGERTGAAIGVKTWRVRHQVISELIQPCMPSLAQPLVPDLPDSPVVTVTRMQVEVGPQAEGTRGAGQGGHHTVPEHCDHYLVAGLLFCCWGAAGVDEWSAFLLMCLRAAVSL